MEASELQVASAALRPRGVDIKTCPSIVGYPRSRTNVVQAVSFNLVVVVASLGEGKGPALRFDLALQVGHRLPSWFA